MFIPIISIIFRIASICRKKLVKTIQFMEIANIKKAVAIETK